MVRSAVLVSSTQAASLASFGIRRSSKPAAIGFVPVRGVGSIQPSTAAGRSSSRSIPLRRRMHDLIFCPPARPRWIGRDPERDRPVGDIHSRRRGSITLLRGVPLRPAGGSTPSIDRRSVFALHCVSGRVRGRRASPESIETSMIRRRCATLVMSPRHLAGGSLPDGGAPPLGVRASVSEASGSSTGDWARWLAVWLSARWTSGFLCSS